MKKKSLKASEMREKSFILGIDIGGSSVKIGHCNVETNKFIGGEMFPLETKTEDSFLSKLREAVIRYNIDKRILGYPNRCFGVGIGCPGPLSPDGGIVINPPNIPLKNFNLRDWAIDLIVPHPNNVFLLNDADAAALGEYSVCNRKKIRNMVFLTLGTGVGSGVVINGRLYRGAGQGGEIGHMTIGIKDKTVMCACGGQGCFEAYVNKKAVIDLMTYRTGIRYHRPWTIEKIKEVIEKDGHPENPTARGVIETIAKYLSVGIDNIITIFQPDKIVLGGGLMDAFGNQIMPHFLKIYTEYREGHTFTHPPIREAFKRNDFIGSLIHEGFEISAAKLGNNAGWRGAIEYVKQQISSLRADEGVYE